MRCGARSAQPLVTGGDTWKRHERHWHCYADEARVGQEVDYRDRPGHAVAMAPEDVLAWMQAQADRVLPRLEGRWRSGAERLKADEALRGVHLAALSWGKSTGLNIAVADGLVLRLFTHSVGPGDSPHVHSWMIPALCTSTHEGDSKRVASLNGR